MDVWGTPSEDAACTDEIIFVGDGRGDDGRPVAETLRWRSGCFDGFDGAKAGWSVPSAHLHEDHPCFYTYI